MVCMMGLEETHSLKRTLLPVYNAIQFPKDPTLILLDRSGQIELVGWNEVFCLVKDKTWHFSIGILSYLRNGAGVPWFGTTLLSLD